MAQIEYEDMQAGTLMHELGHTLGLYHGGAGTNDYNCKPNYLSVMNYLYQFNLGGFASNTPGVATNTPMRANRPLDFSRNALPNLIKNPGRAPGAVGILGRELDQPSQWFLQLEP